MHLFNSMLPLDAGRGNMPPTAINLELPARDPKGGKKSYRPRAFADSWTGAVIEKDGVTTRAFDGTKDTRHHVIPYENLKMLWNAGVNTLTLASSTPTGGLKGYLESVLDNLSSISSVGWITSAEESDARKMAEDILSGSYYQDSTLAPVSTTALDLLQRVHTWAAGNLFIGPTADGGAVGSRYDDPSTAAVKRVAGGATPVKWEASSQDILGEVRYDLADHAQRALQKIVASGSLAPDLRQAFNKYTDLFDQGGVVPTDTIPEAGGSYQPSAWRALPWNNTKTPATSTGGKDAQWVELRHTGDTYNGFPPVLKKVPYYAIRNSALPDPTAIMLPPVMRPVIGHADLPDSITFDDGVTVDLVEVFNDDAGAVNLMADASNVDMGSLLRYLTSALGIDSGEIPDFIEHLTLSNLHIDILQTRVAPSWEMQTVWDIQISTLLNAFGAGVNLRVAFRKELPGGDFSVSASAGLATADDNEGTVLWFDGALEEVDGAWGLSAVMDATESPVSLIDFAKVFGIEIDPPSESGFQALIPSLSEASFLYRAGDAGILLSVVQLETLEAVIARVPASPNDLWAVQCAASVPGASLSQLPLVGGGVSLEADLAIEYVGLAWVSAGMTRSQIRQINQSILENSQGGHPLPLFPDPPDEAPQFSSHSNMPMLTAGLTVPPGSHRKSWALPLG
ncbi:hypothetical protein [Streptomyces sp. BA2]|uniref:hypothetical protein n=1 Tax=Streptomyces sp. BA2 TaxID=436595 RepID=UPI0013211F47|nr:hypothetical protein [Streptomyces sp. BA2]MWA07710.1 hypothetical protein [Streptomyces sp. BA2]